MDEMTLFREQRLTVREDGMATAYQNGYTPYATVESAGEYQRVFADGTISRHMAYTNSSPMIWTQRSFDWRVVGAVRLTNRGYEAENYSLEQVLYDDLPWKFKNKRQQVHIADYDHGTHRVWMNPDHMFWRMQRPNLLTPKEPWRSLIVCYGNMPVMVSGPFPEFDFPYGKAIETTARRVWYVKWMTWEMKVAINEAYEREWGESLRIPYPEFRQHIYRIINYNTQPDRYLVNGAYPAYVAESLDALIRRLVLSDEKPSLCS